MSISYRLEKLEIAAGVNRCPDCGAPNRPPIIRDETSDAQPGAQQLGAATCPRCGSTPRVVRIVDEMCTEAR